MKFGRGIGYGGLSWNKSFTFHSDLLIINYSYMLTYCHPGTSRQARGSKFGTNIKHYAPRLNMPFIYDSDMLLINYSSFLTYCQPDTSKQARALEIGTDTKPDTDTITPNVSLLLVLICRSTTVHS